MAAAHAQKTLDWEALGSAGFAEAPIEAVTMKPSGATSWAVRAIPFETISTGLDVRPRTQLCRAKQEAIIPENTNPHPPEIAPTAKSSFHGITLSATPVDLVRHEVLGQSGIGIDFDGGEDGGHGWSGERESVRA